MSEPEDASTTPEATVGRRRSVSESQEATEVSMATSGAGFTDSRRSGTEPGDLQKRALDDSTLLLCDSTAIDDSSSVSSRFLNEDAVEDASSSTTANKKQPQTGHLQFGCEMCSNYEIQLQQLQEIDRSHKQKLSMAQTLSDRYHTELSAERLMRNDLETKMASLSADSEEKCSRLLDTSQASTDALSAVQSAFEAQLEALQNELRLVTSHRRGAEQLVHNMEHKYLALLGTHRQTSAAMQDENIELPQTIEELQLHCLTLREELIEAKAAKEHLHESMQSEVALLREQVAEEQSEREQVEANLTEEINGLRTELAIARSAANDLRHMETLRTQSAEHQTTISELETRLAEVQHEKGEIEFNLRETQRKSKRLQQELDAGEAVQRDFVKLSQSLQIELEKIRQAEQEVRWQFDEDVYACNGCQMSFQRSQQKLHCRHCGRVFCDDCLPKTVTAGPQHRPARVCQICHTLLCRTERPYFSENAPTGANDSPVPASQRSS